MIDAESDLEIVGQSDSAEAALPEIERRRPDVAVLDVRLPTCGWLLEDVGDTLRMW
jgi:DNA-binding NarL/FixJ family response regulator